MEANFPHFTHSLSTTGLPKGCTILAAGAGQILSKTSSGRPVVSHESKFPIGNAILQKLFDFVRVRV